MKVTLIVSLDVDEDDPRLANGGLRGPEETIQRHVMDALQNFVGYARMLSVSLPITEELTIFRP